MGRTDWKVKPELLFGEALLILQQRDLEKCIAHYKNLKLDEQVFTGNNIALTKTAHQIAFTTGVWVQRLSEVPDWVGSHLQLLQTDSICLIPSVVFGNKRSLHLYERACIEDFLRYFYYFDHKIEHLLLQADPTRYETIDFLIKWIKNYPALADFKDGVTESCNGLKSGYKRLSRTVHGTTVSDVQLVNSLKQLSQPLAQPTKEMNLMKLIFRNIFFLLSLFHLDKYQAFNLDEKWLVGQHLTPKQKRILNGLE
jgi:hypothetical protein